MFLLYNFFVIFATFILKLVALFSPKIKLFVNGRKNTFKTLEHKLSINEETIWFHAASLGEYEQGLPVMEKIKASFPQYKIVLSFFSPSGYEVRKNNTIADVTVYLPLDTNENAKKWIKTMNPKLVFFIKYEFWPNYLNQLKVNNIPTYLISGIFRENQIFFKSYGGFYRNCLKTFNYFFVQNNISKVLLHGLNIDNVTVSGDTRLDRVCEILNRNNQLDFVNNFVQNKFTIVSGSTWKADEDLLIPYINSCSKDIKFIIAPHNIKTNEINELKKHITKKTILFSEINNQDISGFDVLIVDTIGLLTKIYSKANVAFVGGGFNKSGVHNVLEPAVFGVPILIGKNYSNFQEAKDLVKLKGIISVTNANNFKDTINQIIDDKNVLDQMGKTNKEYVLENKGATDEILEYILKKHK